MKVHPVTGEPVPDERAQVPLDRYANPRRAEWPEADFVVGNPPFIGTKRMKQALGDGYVDALRKTWNEIPESADYVMYWWEKAAELAGSGQLRRFGFITTNSLRQAFNRKVLERHLLGKPPLSLVFAIPDHPWVDAADGAAVRIAMTVGESGDSLGELDTVQSECSGQGEGLDVELVRSEGKLNADLTVGANVTAALPLAANAGISGMGVALHGAGFILDPEVAERLRTEGPAVIRGYLGGRDLLQQKRERYLIDFSGLSEAEARTSNPAAYQRVLDFVKPERDHNRRDSIRNLWWRFGWERPILRRALTGLSRYIGTTETAKHRVFQFLPDAILADHMVVCFALDDATNLGILSSRVHVVWALAAGGHLGVGNDPRYNKSRCFEPFPFPAPAEPQKSLIRQLAEDLDSHRKSRQSMHPSLTMTGMYNVLDLLRRGQPLSPKEKTIHEQGLVSVLRQIHDELDAAVLGAYGWSDLTPALLGSAPGSESAAEVEETILQRLVALNAERAAEERRGLIRWLRPEFQNPGQSPAGTGSGQSEAKLAAVAPAGSGPKPDWPRTLPEQFQSLRAALAARPGPAGAQDLARCFARAPRAKVAELMETLVALGHVRRLPDGRFLA